MEEVINLKMVFVMMKILLASHTLMVSQNVLISLTNPNNLL